MNSLLCSESLGRKRMLVYVSILKKKFISTEHVIFFFMSSIFSEVCNQGNSSHSFLLLKRKSLQVKVRLSPWLYEENYICIFFSSYCHNCCAFLCCPLHIHQFSHLHVHNKQSGYIAHVSGHKIVRQFSCRERVDN